MNKPVLYSLTLAALAGTVSPLSAQQAPESTDKRPNIILFMVDDMGWQDTSLPFWTEKTYYNSVYETPNMERLAKQGMMFTQAYACPLSSATRCSLITGANNVRHRVTNWTLEKNKTTDRSSETLQLPDWNYNGVSQVPGTNNTYVGTSFVELLRQSGYHTIHCGKAHFGAIDTPGENPIHWGFEVNIAGHAAGGLASYLSEVNYGHTKDGKPYSLMSIPGLEDYWGTGTFVTEALTQEAIKALDKAKKYNQPFYLYMAHYAIHIPIDKDMRFFPKYVRKGLSDKEAAYASLIEGMDKSLGDLMDWLEKNGEADNTIFIFMSDNGGLAAEPGWRDGTPHTQNAPLRSGKGSMYEGGIREPMIVKWPGEVQPDTRCDKYLIIEDFYPTILEMAGVKSYKTRQVIDGVSFADALKEHRINPDRTLIWHFPNLWGETQNKEEGYGAYSAILKGDYHLIYTWETRQLRLYNVKEDIGEQNDLAQSMPDKVKELAKELSDYLRARDAQRPTLIQTNSLIPYPDEK